ncbi:uncharacterized protein LOC128236931 [Mya arenaria]|uniref:uncharacterized protein LOC128236931 n=1 Tax=Mya arenaria TaxID=6604 RepID=UPI0022E48CB9|nr:uncharacterized protein LOC128236931 [Mya arenaria]
MSSFIFKNSSECASVARGAGRPGRQGISPSVEVSETLFLVVGFGAFSAVVAILFVFIRTKVYKDKNTLDTAFDAGGKVSVGLTATTIVSQWTWASALLYSPVTATQFGISGPYWYAAGATIQILLFSIVSVKLKTRAPGAKTFLQVIKARFGAATHKVFVFYALLTNLIVIVNCMLGASTILSTLTKDMSVEYAAMLTTFAVGTYTLIGGLGATFYVSFFNTAIICVTMLTFVIKVYDSGETGTGPLGSSDSVYSLLSCIQGPEGNEDKSYFTLKSSGGFMFGLITITSCFNACFVDQAYWQSSVAAKPRQGVVGFLAGGLVWFCIPFAMATTMGLAYVALSVQQDLPLLSDQDIDKALVTPAVAASLFGKAGELMVIAMVVMAVVSTGSSEVIAITSIIIYDIYMLYLKPFRLNQDANSCILCGKMRGRKSTKLDRCACESMTVCATCASDDSPTGLKVMYFSTQLLQVSCMEHGGSLNDLSISRALARPLVSDCMRLFT